MIQINARQAQDIKVTQRETVYALKKESVWKKPPAESAVGRLIRVVLSLYRFR
jgi:hypothetical protein